jgi:hypothetical protein
LAWTSEAARNSWGPAFQKVRSAIVYGEFASLSSGLRSAALFQLTEGELKTMEALWREHDLAWEQLNLSDGFLSTLIDAVCVRGVEPANCFVAGKPRALLQFSAASRRAITMQRLNCWDIQTVARRRFTLTGRRTFVAIQRGRWLFTGGLTS